MNLRKLVPLEVHGRLGNTIIAKKYFPMLEWSVPYMVGKIKKRAFQKVKNTPIRYLFREIQPREVPGLKIEKFPGVSHSDP